MAQHDYVIANGSGAAVRSDLNNALAAIVSNNSGATAPSTTYAYMPWADTTTGLYKIRNAANTGWITLYQLDGEWSSIAFEDGTAAAPSIYFKDSGTDTGFYSPGTNQVGISTGGTARAIVDSSGRLLVGTTSTSADALTVIQGRSAASTGDGTLYLSRGSSPGTNGNPLGTLNFSDNGHVSAAQIKAIRDGATYTSGSDQPSAIAFSTTLDGTATLSERLRITNNGLVGVGTSSPGSLLEISGSNPVATIYNTSTGSYGITWESDYATGASRASIFLDHINLEMRYTAGASGESYFQAFHVNGSERARIDTTGRLLIGTSTALTNLYVTSGTANTPQVQLVGTTNSTSSLALVSTSNSGLGRLHLASGGSGSNVVADDPVGAIHFSGYDGTNYINTARIQSLVDGTPGAGDMPGRLTFSTVSDGGVSIIEGLRITNDQVICYNQPAPTSKSAAATLTVAELKTGIIQYTGAAATLTLPTGTLTEGGFSGIYTNMTFEWSVINTGSGTCTIGAGTAHTIVGAATITAGASGRFASRRTASNTFVSYRLA